MTRFEKSQSSLRELAGAAAQTGGGWLEGDSAAMAVHILSAD